MKRKLVKQAGQAVTITLPIDWIRKHNLKPGDEIDLLENDNNIILTSEKKSKGGSIDLDLKGYSWRMKNLFMNAAYAKGYDEVKMESSKNDYPYLNQYMGYAVVSQKQDLFTVRDISGVSGENLDEIFKRIFQRLIGIYDSAIEDIFGKEQATEDTLRRLDEEINKLALFLERSIMKSSYPDSSIGRIIFAYAFELERLGDNIVRLWRTNINEKVLKTSQLKEIVNISRQSLQKAFEIYYQYSPDRVAEIVKLKQLVREKCKKITKLNPATSFFIKYSTNIVEDCADLTQLSLMRRMK